MAAVCGAFRHVLLSGPKLQNTKLTVACENIRFSSLFAAGDVSRGTSPAAKSEEKRIFSQAKLTVLRRFQTSGRLRKNNWILKGFQIHVPGKCFVSSIMSKFWWYVFHRQHKPLSSPQQRIFPLIFIATIRQIFCLSPLLLMCIRCQFFASWIPFEHFNFSLRLQPHYIPIKTDWRTS